MTAKEYFDRMDELNRQIRLKLQRASFLRETLKNVTPVMESEQVSHTRNMHLMTDKISAIVDTEREADALVDELVDVKNYLITYINQLTEAQESLFLKERYYDEKSTKQIAQTHSLSRRRVQQILENAIEHLDELLEKE